MFLGKVLVLLQINLPVCAQVCEFGRIGLPVCEVVFGQDGEVGAFGCRRGDESGCFGEIEGWVEGLGRVRIWRGISK